MKLLGSWTRRALRAIWCANCGAYIENPVWAEPCPKCGK